MCHISQGEGAGTIYISLSERNIGREVWESLQGVVSKVEGVTGVEVSITGFMTVSTNLPTNPPKKTKKTFSDRLQDLEKEIIRVCKGAKKTLAAA